jgi:hypothetical protein
MPDNCDTNGRKWNHDGFIAAQDLPAGGLNLNRRHFFSGDIRGALCCEDE